MKTLFLFQFRLLQLPTFNNECIFSSIKGSQEEGKKEEGRQEGGKEGGEKGGRKQGRKDKQIPVSDMPS